MAGIAAIGETARIQGFALAGARVYEAGDAAAVRAAWDALDAGIAVVVLTPDAARALGDVPPGDRLTVVMPP